MNKQIVSKYSVFGAVAVVVLLAGCGAGKKDKASSASASSHSSASGDTVLCTINGKPVVTVEQYEQYYNNFIAANPRLQAMIQFLPNAKQEIFKSMVNQEIVSHWAADANIEKDAAYIKELETAMTMIKRELAAKSFQDKFIGKVSVSDSEVKEYYEAHKNPDLILTPGGVKAMGVEFGNKGQAQAFYDKVKSNGAGFKSVATAEKQKVREFAPINAFSFDVDKNVKDKLSEAKSFPAVVMVEGADKKFWVAVATGKEETKYRTLEEVREGIKSVVEREKMAKIWGEKLEELRKKYNVEENAAFFESQQAHPAAAQLSPEDLEMLAQNAASQETVTA